jgi:hypothetical protein
MAWVYLYRAFDNLCNHRYVGTMMTICKWCEMEMNDDKTKSCLNFSMEDENCKKYNPVPYDGKRGKRCPDCYVKQGGIHHPGCDIEKCPICNLQMISCAHKFY